MVYSIDYDQLFYGADFDFWAAPFFEAKNFMLRMELGVKYVYIQETFNVQATDSGLDYTFTGADGARPSTTQSPLPPAAR